MRLRTALAAFLGTALASAPLVASAGPQIAIDLHIIGFDVDSSTQKQLKEMAAAGGGAYYDSSDESGLTSALGTATGVRPAATANAEPVEAVESEPNDTRKEADHIAINGETEGAIQTKGDVDWFRVTIPRQGALSLKTKTVPPGIDLVWRVFDADFAALTGWAHPAKPGGETTDVIDLPRGGSYWIEVRDGGNNASAKDPYRLLAAFTPTADSGEPNDAYGDATPLAFDRPVKASLLPRGDADWYAITAPAQGELTVNVGDVPPNLDIVLRVWSADVQAISGWLQPARPGGDTVGIVDLPAPGIYRLEVRDGGNNARAVEPYTLTATFVPTGDAAEPNDRISDAKPIELDKEIPFAILPRGDVDWYRLDLLRGGALDIAVTGVADALDIVYRLWDQNGQAITGWANPARAGADTLAVFDVAEGGTYRLEIRDGGNNARAVAPAKLKVRFTPTIDPGEPNNAPRLATPVHAGLPLQAHLLPRGDVDWYVIEAGTAGKLDVALTQVAKSLDLVARLWSLDGSPISGWLQPPRPGGDTLGQLDLPLPGRYFLEVRDGGNNARAEQPYTLALKFPEAAKAPPPAQKPAQSTAPQPTSAKQPPAGSKPAPALAGPAAQQDDPIAKALLQAAAEAEADARGPSGTSAGGSAAPPAQRSGGTGNLSKDLLAALGNSAAAKPMAGRWRAVLPARRIELTFDLTFDPAQPKGDLAITRRFADGRTERSQAAVSALQHAGERLTFVATPAFAPQQPVRFELRHAEGLLAGTLVFTQGNARSMRVEFNRF